MCACVCVGTCRALTRVCVCMCENEKTTSCVFKFVLLFVSPHKGNTAIKGTKFSWCVFQPRGSQLCKECRMCTKSLHSLLNSHTTIVMYSTVHMYSIAAQGEA